MSWLDSVEYRFLYRCAEGHQSITVGHNCDREPIPCQGCEGEAEYQKMLPLEMNIAAKVAFDQNGVKAYRITDQKGHVHHMAQSKYNMMSTGDYKPTYTKAYEEHLKSTGEGHRLEGQTRSEAMEARKNLDQARGKLIPEKKNKE